MLSGIQEIVEVFDCEIDDYCIGGYRDYSLHSSFSWLSVDGRTNLILQIQFQYFHKATNIL